MFELFKSDCFRVYISQKIIKSYNSTCFETGLDNLGNLGMRARPAGQVVLPRLLPTLFHIMNRLLVNSRASVIIL